MKNYNEVIRESDDKVVRVSSSLLWLVRVSVLIGFVFSFVPFGVYSEKTIFCLGLFYTASALLIMRIVNPEEKLLQVFLNGIWFYGTWFFSALSFFRGKSLFMLLGFVTFLMIVDLRIYRKNFFILDSDDKIWFVLINVLSVILMIIPLYILMRVSGHDVIINF